MADAIIVLDGDDDDVRPLPSTGSAPTNQPEAEQVPLSSASEPLLKKGDGLQADNEKRFAEFMEHCFTVIPDQPEVLTYLRNQHAKASADFLSSVEFRNTLERCFSRARKNVGKIYVFINELCTVLKQRSAKRSLRAVKVETAVCRSPAVELPGGSAAKSADDNEASTSSVKEEEEKKKRRRASQKQIAYLENLLRLYNEEIRRLQLTELSLDDMASEDSLHIQEHKLKRKMMKIYEKLCELKGCDTLTGRVIEQRIFYTATRYPEINKKIERYINRPEVRHNPPDYHDINRLVTRANERYKLCLDRKQLIMLAKEAFRDIGTRIQERRHLDLVYNFGSHLTDAYKPAQDPALADPALLRKLKSNREESLSRLEEVISKFAVKQEDTEVQERSKRLQKTDPKLKNENGVSEEKPAEEEEDEEEESSDPDIEEEIQASIQQADDDEAECSSADAGDHENGGDGAPASDAARNGDEASGQGSSPLSDGSNADSTPPPPSISPTEGGDQEQGARPLANGTQAACDKNPPTQASAPPVSSSDVAPTPYQVKSSSTSPPPFTPVSQKRKREAEPSSTQRVEVINSEVESPLDMGVFTCSPPEEELVSSTQLTPPPKKNKVNVSTQCDPVEVIVLSDSD